MIIPAALCWNKHFIISIKIFCTVLYFWVISCNVKYLRTELQRTDWHSGSQKQLWFLQPNGFVYARALHARYLISECKVFYCRTVQNFVSFLQLNLIKNNVDIIKWVYWSIKELHRWSTLKILLFFCRETHFMREVEVLG